MNQPTKSELVDALRALINKRARLDAADYASAADLARDRREIAAQKRAADQLLRIVERASYIYAPHILEQAARCRVEFVDGKAVHNAFQYPPTEYRAAVAQLCGLVLWYSVREDLGDSGSADNIRAAMRKNWGLKPSVMRYVG